MDQAGWLGCTRLFEMLPLVEQRMSDRKRRLFAVACCRRFAHLLEDERSRQALAVAERYADGEASEVERIEAEDAAVDVHILLRENRFTVDPMVTWSRQAELLTQATILAISPGIYYAGDAADYTRLSMLAASGRGEEEREEEAIQCRLLRDVVGPLPLGLPALQPRWLACNDCAAVQIARWIYQARAFDDLPILADALEEAGCMDEVILAHCREEREHVRGCWLVDAVRSEE